MSSMSRCLIITALKHAVGCLYLWKYSNSRLNVFMCHRKIQDVSCIALCIYPKSSLTCLLSLEPFGFKIKEIEYKNTFSWGWTISPNHISKNPARGCCCWFVITFALLTRLFIITVLQAEQNPFHFCFQGSLKATQEMNINRGRTKI